MKGKLKGELYGIKKYKYLLKMKLLLLKCVYLWFFMYYSKKL